MGLTLAFGFTGYLLPWNELAFFATRVGTEIPGVIPLIGPFVRRLLRGGDDVTGATLTRFYGIHVAVLPAIVTMVLGLHLFLVQKHGMSSPPSGEEDGQTKTHDAFLSKFFLARSSGLALRARVCSRLLPLIIPAELGKKADPFQPAPIGIKPEWYFMAMFQTLKLLPSHILGIEGELLGVLAIWTDWVDLGCIAFSRSATLRWEKSRTHVAAAFGILLIVYSVVLTYLGYTMSPTK